MFEACTCSSACFCGRLGVPRERRVRTRGGGTGCLSGSSLRGIRGGMVAVSAPWSWTGSMRCRISES